MVKSRVPAAPGRVVQRGWGHLVASIAPHTPPFLAWGLLPVPAAAARHFWATSIPAAMGAAITVLVLVAGLTGFAWHVFKPRGHSVRVHATASVGAGGVWLIVALIAGLRSEIVWSIWIVGGIAICLAWTFRRVARGEGHDTHHDDSGDKALTAAVGLAGAQIKAPKVIGPKVKASMQLVRGEQTTADAQGAARRIDSHLGLRRGATRIIENQEDESRPHIEIVPKDPLVKPIRWAGPHAPGESIAEKIEFATYDDGSRAGLWFPGQNKPPRVGAHVKVAGMTGAGKTEGGLVLCTNVLCRAEASLIYIDSVKGIQSVRAIIDAVDLPIIDRSKAVQFMKRLQPIIRARTEWLGQHGYSQWEPGCGLKYLVVWIEESADLIADSTSFTKVTEQARSAGISLVASQQRWTHDRVDTSARANFGAGICFGVDNEDSANAVLSDDTIDAGASPWTWKNTKPGYLYLEAPGVDSRMWTSPARADLAETGHLTEAVTEWANPGLDPTTALAIGELYADHTSMVGEGKAPWQKPVVTATRMPKREVEPDDIDEPDDDGAEDDYEYAVPPTPDPDFMPDIDPEQEIPDDDHAIIALSIPIDTTKMGRTDAVAELRRELAARAAVGVETIRPSELVELRQRIGRSPAWLSGELATLVEEGFLTEEPDRGVYGLPTPVPA